MRVKLSPAQRRSIQNVSRPAVTSAFGGLKKQFSVSKWLPKGNVYRTATVARIKDHLDPNTSTSLVSKQAADYIAASVPLHVLDGWSFLGRAVDASARGDADVARHLAYYAELRAAVSLLAHEGLGVFSGQHLVVDPMRTVTKFPGGNTTHVVTWLALEYWASLKKSGDLVGVVIEAFGYSLGDWVDAFTSGSSTVRPVASRWLRRWGLDLHRMIDDRESRNEASYRPSGFSGQQQTSVTEVIGFLHDVWHLCEPTSDGKFSRLDQFLVRRTLADLFQALHGESVVTKPNDYERMVRFAVVQLGLPPTDLVIDFLTFKTLVNDPLLLRLAERSDDATAASHHLQVMGRALLLLRIASGASRELMRSASVKQAHVEFWWKNFGLQRGLWRPDGEPESLSDQWLDVEHYVQEMSEWSSQGASHSYASWRQDQPSTIGVIGECERIGLWGLGL